MAFGGVVKLTGESEYRKAIKEITSNLKVLSSEMKVVNSTYDKNDSSINALNSRNAVLNKTLEQQSKKLEEAKKMLDESKNSTESNEATTNKWQIALNNAQAEVNKTQNAIDKNNEAIKQMTEETNKAEGELKDFGETTADLEEATKKASDGFTIMKGVLANLISQGISKAIEGAKKLGTAFVNVGKQALESYADYEQLQGGVETLFKDSSKEVMKYAQESYKTAGLSANKYMEQMTSFSASLIQGLGGDTKKASQIGNMAIIDMSDNANKMGTSIEMIQNAYQGFAKQNYTMLDNLKLGFGGTAGEMARLVNESGVMGKSFKATAKNIKEVPFDKLIEAIHETQVQMGITGTTSKEASSTIQGSVNTMKGAWQNLLTGIADGNQDLMPLIKNLGDSIVNVAKNILPRIKPIIKGIGDAIKQFVNTEVPKIIAKLPPTFQKAIKIIQDLFQWFVDHKNVIVSAITGIVTAFAVVKILNFASAVGNVISVLTSAPTIIAGVTKALELMNLTALANPYVLLAGAITGVVVAIGLWISKSDEKIEQMKKEAQQIEAERDEVVANKEAYDKLNEAKQNSINEGFSEIDHYKTLYSELQNLVDENGKVKEGYEGRAKFITTTLSDALGVEIDNNGKVIKNYQDLKDSIDQLIEKKKAEILLSAQEESYKKAIQDRQQALQNLATYQTQYDKKQEELRQAEETRNNASSTSEWNRANRVAGILSDELYDLGVKKKAQEDLISQYAYNIGQYENNMALAHQGKYDEMNNVTWSMVSTTQTATDQKKAILEQEIANEQIWLNTLKTQRDENNTTMYDDQITASEKLIAQKKKELEDYTSTITTGNQDAVDEWKTGLGDQLDTITGKNYEFKDCGDGTIQMFIDGVAQGKPLAEASMKTFITDVIQKVKDGKVDSTEAGKMILDGLNNGLDDTTKQNEIKTTAKDVGEDAVDSVKEGADVHSPSRATEQTGKYILDGLKKGIDNQDKRNSIFRSLSNLGTSMLNKFKSTFGIASPSKITNKYGQYLVEGLGLGIEKQENSVLSEVQSFGKNVVGSLQNQLSSANLKMEDVKLPNAQGDIRKGLSTESTDNNLYKVIDAFKVALGDMKIEMNDEQMGKFVDKTITEAIYN